MKRIALSLLLALSAAAVQAQAPAAPVAPAAPLDAAEPVDAAGPADAGEPAVVIANVAKEEAAVIAEVAEEEPSRHCLRETGTRIKRRDDKGCTNAIGESYSGDELRRTGGRDTAEALRLLSPRIGG